LGTLILLEMVLIYFFDFLLFNLVMNYMINKIWELIFYEIIIKNFNLLLNIL